MPRMEGARARRYPRRRGANLHMERDPHIVVLAAGPGKKMQSRKPKVMHAVLFRPMLHYVLELAASLPHRSISLVIGQNEEEVAESARAFRGVRAFTQDLPLGTGYAVQAVEPFL